MNSRRGARISPFFLGLLMLAGCGPTKDPMVVELLSLDAESYEGQVSESSIEELQETIEALEEEVGRTIDAGERLITYYKTVAVRYMARELYGLAADFLRKALDVQPTNRLVAYRLGVCVAQVALSQTDIGVRTRKFEEAEAYYLYALRLDPMYDEALYAISVLYVFELERPLEAEPYLERLLAAESRHFTGMFLLARVYVLQGRVDDAMTLYSEIVSESRDRQQVAEAKKNRLELNGALHGS
jgi:tetratricopeptide (TPR) repeat protein